MLQRKTKVMNYNISIFYHIFYQKKVKRAILPFRIYRQNISKELFCHSSFSPPLFATKKLNKCIFAIKLCQIKCGFQVLGNLTRRIFCYVFTLAVPFLTENQIFLNTLIRFFVTSFQTRTSTVTTYIMVNVSHEILTNKNLRP